MGVGQVSVKVSAELMARIRRLVDEANADPEQLGRATVADAIRRLIEDGLAGRETPPRRRAS